MPTCVLRVTGRDPLLFGDGRPFAADPGALSARSLPLPLPGTLAGFCRTCLGNLQGWRWEEGGDGPSRALATTVAGPLLLRRGANGTEELFFSAPADGVVMADEDGEPARVMPLRPWSPPAGAGCLAPEGLRPLRVTEDGKPASGYVFWPAADLWTWLAAADGTRDGAPFPPPAAQSSGEDCSGPPREERVHVGIDSERYTSRAGHLYTTQGVWFGETWALLARIEGEEVRPLTGLSTLGGERRLARVEPAETLWPACPGALREALSGARKVRMLLATPAHFEAGWRPAGARPHSEWSPPGVPEVGLRLVAAAVPRRQPVSGWDLRGRRPKRVRWLAPAGSVYFFDVVRGDAAALAERAWLRPVSDTPHDRRDGYGLALWGVAAWE